MTQTAREFEQELDQMINDWNYEPSYDEELIDPEITKELFVDYEKELSTSQLSDDEKKELLLISED